MAGLLSFALVGCATPDGKTSSTPAEVTSGEPLVETTLPSDRPPAFSRATVVRLNGIVQRSLDTIEEFDRGRPLAADERAGSDADEAGSPLAGRARLAWLEALDARAKSAREDMAIAAATLRSSGEAYNATLLAGMVKFVDRVAEEIAEAAATLRSELAENDS